MAGASLLAVVMMIPGCVMATSYGVGGDGFGWSALDVLGPGYGGVPNFFQNFANAHHPRLLFDLILSDRYMHGAVPVFRFNKEDSVLWVSHADYLACNTQHPMRRYDPAPGASSNPVTFPLANHGMSTLYFIGGKPGNCAAGQRVYYDVLN